VSHSCHFCSSSPQVWSFRVIQCCSMSFKLDNFSLSSLDDLFHVSSQHACRTCKGSSSSVPPPRLNHTTTKPHKQRVLRRYRYSSSSSWVVRYPPTLRLLPYEQDLQDRQARASSGRQRQAEGNGPPGFSGCRLFSAQSSTSSSTSLMHPYNAHIQSVKSSICSRRGSNGKVSAKLEI
jgi:hypothetical protein